MPEYNVTIVETTIREYVITLRAKNEDEAGDKALERFHKAKESGKNMPEEVDYSEDTEVQNVEEA